MTGLTKTQIEALIRIRDKGPAAWARGRSGSGGACARMFNRMVILGLVTRPPRELTDRGRAALAVFEAKKGSKR